MGYNRTKTRQSIPGDQDPVTTQPLDTGTEEKHELVVLLAWNFANLQQTCKEPTLLVHK